MCNCSKKVEVKFMKAVETAKIPVYATAGASGMDVSSVEEVTIKGGERALVSTGLTAVIPEGYEIQVRPRSGLALKKGITVLNTPGTIDSDYRGIIRVILYNASKEDFQVNVGDRIAQLVVARAPQALITEIYEIEDTTERGAGGFGSTGVN